MAAVSKAKTNSLELGEGRGEGRRKDCSFFPLWCHFGCHLFPWWLYSAPQSPWAPGLFEKSMLFLHRHLSLSPHNDSPCSSLLMFVIALSHKGEGWDGGREMINETELCIVGSGDTQVLFVCIHTNTYTNPTEIEELFWIGGWLGEWGYSCVPYLIVQGNFPRFLFPTFRQTFCWNSEPLPALNFKEGRNSPAWWEVCSAVTSGQRKVVNKHLWPSFYFSLSL